ncbi:MAG: sugar ABC transporter permease [Treponema sp.]|nr:sugar ABC transporter permease [Treponema sp.]
MKSQQLRELRNLRNGIIFISPWLAGFLIFALYPMAQAFYYSFTDFSGMVRAPVWIGLDNFKTMLTGDKLFLTVAKNTLFMVFFGGSLILLVTLTIAILLNHRSLKWVSGFRVIFFLPTLVPSIVLCILWLWLFNVDSGLINSVLKLFGIRGPGWLASLAWSKPALAIMRLWCAGNLIIIFLGGLQDISPELYEAVDIDGGNFWHKTIHITIPMLRPIILFNVISTINGLMQMFVEPLTMTRSGQPNNMTYTYALYIYNNAFKYSKMGYASALSWVMLIITLALTFIALKFGGFFEERES